MAVIKQNLAKLPYAEGPVNNAGVDMTDPRHPNFDFTVSDVRVKLEYREMEALMETWLHLMKGG